MDWIHILLLFIRGILRDRTELAAENLALRQQLAALQHRSKRPRLRKRDRIFWAILSRIWRNWRSALLFVQPDTVVRWHRQGPSLFTLVGDRTQDLLDRCAPIPKGLISQDRHRPGGGYVDVEVYP